MNIWEKFGAKIVTLDDQEASLISPNLAYRFAKLNIPGTDIEKCQRVACKKMTYAYRFAKYVKGADIDYCREAVRKNKQHLQDFDRMIELKIKSVLA